MGWLVAIQPGPASLPVLLDKHILPNIGGKVDCLGQGIYGEAQHNFLPFLSLQEVGELLSTIVTHRVGMQC